MSLKTSSPKTFPLKTFTGLCLVVSLGASIVWGFLFAASPRRDAPLPERRAYAQKIVAATFVALGSLVAAGVGSILILRRTREEYRVASRRNMESLVTGLRADASERATASPGTDFHDPAPDARDDG